MTLADLVGRLGATASAALPPAVMSRKVSAIVYDSRRAAADSLFVALRGQHADGAAFAAQAVARGALAVVGEGSPPASLDAPWIQVSDARAALAMLAAAFYRDPSHDLLVVGVTGTNGKTTTTYLVQAIFDAASVRCGRLGTITYDTGRGERDASRTTPEAPEVQALLREMVGHGCGACAMEVSSHALELRRVDGTRFAAAVFTNLTRDHLDFHGSMDAYFRAKARLFEMLPDSAPAVLNADDPRGVELAGLVRRPISYAIDAPADVRPRRIEPTLEGLAFDVDAPGRTLRVRSSLVGRPNAANLLAAAATGVALDLTTESIERGLSAVAHVPGRFQRVSSPSDDVAVIVDYAHTDDALRGLLETVRPLAKGRVVTVFGCGGDRDRTKRPLMGAVAARLSDFVVLTSDNPRSEDPALIIEEIKRGLVPPGDRPLTRHGQPVAAVRATPWIAVVDRAEAIRRAIAKAAPGDLVVIAGKGHEKYQEAGGRVVPFDDVAVATEALRSRRSGTAVSRS